ncbi:MAG: hypothetical protein ACI9WU_002231 [Myxococcota bacterium]
MNARALAGGLIAAGIAAAVWFAASGTSQKAQPEATTDTPASVAAPEPETPEPTTKPKPPEEPPLEPPRRASVRERRLAIPVVTDQGVATIHLTAEAHTEPRLIIRVQYTGTAKNGKRRWEAHLRAAAFAALEAQAIDEIQGLRLHLDANRVAPRADQMAPLAVAIRAGVAGRIYPEKALIVGIVAPDLSIFTVERKERYERVAAKYSLRYVRPNDLHRMLASLELAARPPRPPRGARTAGAPSDLYAVDKEAVGSALREVLGQVSAGRPATRVPSADWRELVARAETRLKASRIRGADELTTLGVAAAQIRQAIRVMRFCSERIKPYTQKLIRDRTPLEGYPVGWLTALIQAHSEAERTVRAWLPATPPPGERPRLAELPTEDLRARAAQLAHAADAFEQALDGYVPRPTQLPRPWPRHDIRNLAWPARGEAPSRSPAADWGVQLHRLTRAWAQLTTVVALRPQRGRRTPEIDSIMVKDAGRLDGMLEGARKRAESGYDIFLTPEQIPLAEVRRLLGRVPSDGGTTPAQKVRSLEQLWYATILGREARRFEPLIQRAGRR